MIRTSLLAAVALTVLTGTAWAETWTGGERRDSGRRRREAL